MSWSVEKVPVDFDKEHFILFYIRLSKTLQGKNMVLFPKSNASSIDYKAALFSLLFRAHQPHWTGFVDGIFFKMLLFLKKTKQNKERIHQ